VSDDRIVLLDSVPCRRCGVPVPLYVRLRVGGDAGLGGFDGTAFAEHYAQHLGAAEALAFAERLLVAFGDNLVRGGFADGVTAMLRELDGMDSAEVRELNAAAARHGGICGLAASWGERGE